MNEVSKPRRPDSGLRTVFRFALGHWARRKGRAIALAGAMSLATVTEIFVPVFAGRMIDALSLGAEGREAAWLAFAGMIGLGLAMVSLRHLAWWMVVPFTLAIMRDAAAGRSTASSGCRRIGMPTASPDRSCAR